MSHRVVAPLILGISALLLPAIPASGGKYEYRVVGVDRPDVLNVRERVDDQSRISEAKILGQIPANASGVLGTGASQRVGRQRWFEVRYGETLGWVNGRYLAPLSARIGKELESNLFCSGTEPFWALRIENETAEVRQPGDQVERFSVAVREPFQDREDTLAIRLVNDTAPEVSALIQQKEWCSDGMSDLDYAFEVRIIGLGGSERPLRGCCSLLR